MLKISKNDVNSMNFMLELIDFFYLYFYFLNDYVYDQDSKFDKIKEVIMQGIYIKPKFFDFDDKRF